MDDDVGRFGKHQNWNRSLCACLAFACEGKRHTRTECKLAGMGPARGRGTGDGGMHDRAGACVGSSGGITRVQPRRGVVTYCRHVVVVSTGFVCLFVCLFVYSFCLLAGGSQLWRGFDVSALVGKLNERPGSTHHASA